MTKATRARSLVLVAALSVTLAGCTQTSAGTPMPDGTTTGDGSSVTSPTGSSDGPSSSRPREIKLDGEDPCGLISETDWTKLGIERPGKRSDSETFKSPRCYYSSVGDVTLVVTDGISAWTEKAHDVEVSESSSIADFPTLTVWNEVDRRSCYTAVDVADDQHLLTTATSVNANADRVETCERSYQLAESAMKTLVAS